MRGVGGVQRTERDARVACPRPYAERNRRSSSGSTNSQTPDAASTRNVQTVNSAATGFVSGDIFTYPSQMTAKVLTWARYRLRIPLLDRRCVRGGQTRLTCATS